MSLLVEFNLLLDLSYMARPGESEEEYRARKRKEKESETPEQRAARKAKEAERDKKRPKETEEERAARKAKEARPKETDEERAARKAKEARPKETDEERAVRKAKEAEREKRDKERPKETEEERAVRKAKEAERDKRPKETEEERAARKAKERAKDEEKSRKEVVHKQLHALPSKETGTDKAPAPAQPSRDREPKVQIKPDRVEEEDEGYDEDFEDGFAEEELENVYKALEEENARLRKEADARKRKEDEVAAARKKKDESAFGGRGGNSRRKNDSSSEEDDNDEGEERSKFGAGDLQRQKYRAQFDKDLERANALRRLIDLESVSVTIADIAPMSEYDRYIRSFGGAGRAQASVQAPPIADIVNAEVQADRVHLKAKGCQCPDDLGLFPERLIQLQEQRRLEAAAAAKSGLNKMTTSTSGPNNSADEAPSGATSSTAASRKSVDTTALSSFLSRVFPVVRSILDENDQLVGKRSGGANSGNAAVGGGGATPETAGAPFSSAVSTLGCKLVEGRPVIEVVISPASPQFVTALYGEHPRPDAPLAKYPTVALVWNTSDPRTPDRVLVSTCTLTTITMSTTRQHLVYGGTSSGSVCVWDLREPNFRHKSVPASQIVEGANAADKIAIRSPSFTSMWNATDNHDAAVKQVSVVGGRHPVIGSASIKRDEGEQIISIDNKGVVFYWLVSGGTAAHDDGKGAGSGDGSPRRGDEGRRIGESDFGANFHSSVRLFKSFTINALPPARRGDIVSCVEFFPSDVSQLAVGASQVLHINRFGSLTAPSAYTHHSVYSQVSSVPPVTSIAFGVLDSRVLLAAYEDGTLRLFLHEEAEPKLIITASTAALTRVRASPSTKWITFALDANGTFFVFDHAAGIKTTPVHKSVLKSTSGKCSVFDVAQDVKGSDVRAAFGFEGGLVQVHTIPPERVKAQGARNEMWL